ncbi:Monosaccharide-sensing protein 2 [Datura stramonium]|uniref:Monosaccharide-sensing protein 2 n=1 Tax=Datura stramonium TaxID=4076 RepID=A0ABS8RPL6_DATST|nr:Monosaccharide-sensing protein 2 [Datura stramonium]
MKEAKQVLQRLRDRDDVSGEMALLMEGLGAGGEVSIEEYIIIQTMNLLITREHAEEKDQIKLYGAEEGLSRQPNL